MGGVVEGMGWLIRDGFKFWGSGNRHVALYGAVRCSAQAAVMQVCTAERFV